MTPDPVKVFQFNEIALGFGYSLGRGFAERSNPARPRLKDRSRRGGRPERSAVQRDLALQAMNIKVSPKDYQKLVEQITGKPEERILSYLMLRSLKQARYSPQNHGHFGLASNCYTHFTSPIRRYPDLMVHRILKGTLRSESPGVGVVAGEKAPVWLTFASTETSDDAADAKARRDLRRAKRKEGSPSGELVQGLYSPEALDSLAVHSSEMERRSDEAERELIDLKKLEFMADKLGEKFEGIVIHLTKEGMVVELMDCSLKGLSG
jgi:ribonuclease R